VLDIIYEILDIRYYILYTIYYTLYTYTHTHTHTYTHTHLIQPLVDEEGLQGEGVQGAHWVGGKHHAEEGLIGEGGGFNTNFNIDRVGLNDNLKTDRVHTGSEGNTML
jgi:hypothetical protein